MQRKNPLTDLCAYLLNARQVLSSGETDEESKQGMISGILEEIEGKELDLACDQRGSKHIQNLLSLVGAEQSAELLVRILRGGIDALCNQYASHVIQKGTSRLVSDPSPAVVQELLALLKTDLENLIYHHSATHVIRTFILVCGGFTGLQPGRQQHIALPENATGSPDMDTLTALSELFVPLFDETPVKLFSHAQASPTAQILLLVLARHLPDSVGPIISGLADSVETLVADAVGSHSVECLIKVAAACNRKAYRKLTAAAMAASSTSRFAGFAVQTAITEAKEEKDLLNILKHAVSGSTDSHVLPLLQRLATAAEPHPELQKKVMARLVDFFPAPIVPRLLCSSDWEGLTRPSAAGALLLSTLLKFDRSLIEPIVSDVPEIAKHIAWFTTHKPSMRFLETLLQSKLESADTLVEALIPLLPQLAIDMQNGGSWLVAATFHGASANGKRKLNEALVTIEGLRDINFRLWRICGLNSFKHQPEEWKQNLQKQSKTQALFEDILAPKRRKNNDA